jgi:hypothetical protein
MVEGKVRKVVVRGDIRGHKVRKWKDSMETELNSDEK